MNVREMEAEAKLFWTLARKAAALRLANRPELDDALEIVRGDLEAIAMHSDWPRLRIAAKRALRPRRRRAVG